MPEPAVNVLVSRNQWLAYMKVGTGEASAFALIGEGFTSFSEAKNPKEYSRQYVHEKSERTDVTGYAPSISYSCDIYSADPVIGEIVDITDNELTGTAAHREVVSVNLWQPGATNGTYTAYKRSYAVIADAKGDGTEALIYSGNLKCVGEPVKGTFAIATKTFTDDVV